MSYNPHFISGDWNQECDECGWVYKHNQLRHRWDKLWVCDRDWEPKHLADLKTPRRRTGLPARNINKSSTLGTVEQIGWVDEI